MSRSDALHAGICRLFRRVVAHLLCTGPSGDKCFRPVPTCVIECAAAVLPAEECLLTDQDSDHTCAAVNHGRCAHSLRAVFWRPSGAGARDPRPKHRANGGSWRPHEWRSSCYNDTTSSVSRQLRLGWSTSATGRATTFCVRRQALTRAKATDLALIRPLAPEPKDQVRLSSGDGPPGC